MKAYKKVSRIVLVTIITAFGLTLPTQGQAAKKYISLGTGNPGGTYYFIGAGFANIFNKYVPDVRVIAESTAASEENMNLMLRKKMDLGLAGVHVIPPQLEKKVNLDGIRLIATGHSSDTHWFVRKESPIKKLTDFRGRKVAVGQPGSGILVGSRDFLKVTLGFTFDDIKPAYLSLAESITAIKDNTVDVGLIPAGYPVASILDLSQHLDIRLISYTEEEIKRLLSVRPFYVKIVIPAGTYRGVQVDTITHGSVAGLFCRADLSEELIYKLIKALYEHPKERDAIHPAAKFWTIEHIYRAAEYTTKHVPFHPGSVKFLKEKNAWWGK